MNGTIYRKYGRMNTKELIHIGGQAVINNRISFQAEFSKSKCQPIEYKGKTLVMWDHFMLPHNEVRLKFRIISTNSEWVQGISLETKGTFVFGEGNNIPRSVQIWENTAPKEDEFTCRSKNRILDVKNIWDTGNGCVESWNNGAAMWIEEIPNGRRYHCNDGHFDDDFDELIFEILLVKPEE
jgi:hypothetical protein